MEIPQCPILRPTMKQFRKFDQYVEYLDRTYKTSHGMVKVKLQRIPELVSGFFQNFYDIFQIIPPAQWKPNGNSYQQKLISLNVNGPIEQNIFGKGGVYQCLHIQKKSMTLEEYRAKIGIFDKITNNLSADEVQQMFWKNVVFSPPLYGADLLSTLMDQKAGSWNLSKLSSVLSSALQTQLKGVNTPYCYVGSWKSLFCWHKQDLDLSAINYLHEGKSKFWYSIPQSQYYILQKQAKKQFPDHFAKCEQYLRHKTTLINPYLLKRQYPQLQISKVEHKKNEFILVFGGAYHCGFNFGFNIAEAVNYGTLDWLRQIIECKSCSCSRNVVKASSIQIYRNLVQTQYSKTPQFMSFQEKLFKEVQQDDQSDDSTDIKGLKTQYTKRIKKNKKQRVKRLTFKGQQYDIDVWTQCDSGKIWRKTNKKYRQNQRFICNKIGKKCHQAQKISKSYITL